MQQRIVQRVTGQQIAALQSVRRGEGERCVLFEVPNVSLALALEAEARLPIRCFRHRKLLRAAAPHQNKPVAKVEERAGRTALRAFFCDAVSARASICACKAFNTEESAGSIGSSCKRTTRDSRSELCSCKRPSEITNNTNYASTSSLRNPQPEIHLAHHVPKERFRRRYPSLVWRRQRQALRNDAKRYGQDQAHPQQCAGKGRSLHNPRESDRA